MARIKKIRLTIVDNTVIEDTELSWKAKGVFLYLWSKSDEWQFYETEVTKHAKDGRDSLRSALKELEKKGYLKRARKRNEKGQVTTSDWILSEKPMLKKSTQENPTQENDTLPSTDLTKDLPNQGLSIDREIDTREKLRPVFDFYERNKGYMADVYQQKFVYEYQEWESKQVEHDEIINIFKLAIETVLGKDDVSSTAPYAITILKNWFNNNLLSLNAIEGDRKRRKECNQRKQQRQNGYKPRQERDLSNKHYGTDEELEAEFFGEG